MKNRLCFMIIILLLSFLVYHPPIAHGVTLDLYDNTLAGYPEDQAWLFYGIGGSHTPTSVGGENFINLNSTTNDQIGYSNYNASIFPPQHKNPSFPIMDRNTGFSIEFDLSLISESHDDKNRAGFSITALSQDVWGIELGFWEDEIWAQTNTSSSLFIHGEGVTVDITDEVITYTLTILNNGYSLFADGAPIPILSGGLQNYSALWSGLSPYSLNNYLFFGDNTTSAGANVNLGKVTLKTDMVPEPGTLLLVGLGLMGTAGLGRRWGRRKP